MTKVSWKPGNMLYPLPVIMATVGNETENNIITVAWTGTLCSDPPVTYIAVRPSRYSHGLLKKYGCFVINLTTERLARATDFCGVRSGRDVDKWALCKLTREPAHHVETPMIAESPVNLECAIRSVQQLGTHDVFTADIVNVNVDPRYMDHSGKFHLDRARPIVYSHGTYYRTGTPVGGFGFSVRKKNNKRKRRR
ncbi:MAG: flavin reductase family protein [Eubacteriales bacterium]|nr:flavin reductase family protein [Eubacteriales bacterium]